MRVAVECKSLLLQKAIENFLGSYLVSKKHCDILIKDTKSKDDNVFYISTDKDADLVKPFTKAQLIMALKKRVSSKENIKKESVEDDKLPFEILEKRIEQLTQEYQRNIIRAIKAFYE